MSSISPRSLQVFVANSEAEMLRFPAMPGDQCRRDDTKRNYQLARLPADLASNWTLTSVYSTDFALSFSVNDWQGPEAGSYKLRVQHNLKTHLINTTIFDANTGKLVNFELALQDENVVWLQCPAIPDGRLDLVVAIIGITL
jgi:hypothetical protein